MIKIQKILFVFYFLVNIMFNWPHGSSIYLILMELVEVIWISVSIIYNLSWERMK